MRTHSLLCLALLALAGCAMNEKVPAYATQGSRQAEFSVQFADGMLCTSNPCTVKITVAANCSVTVDPMTLGVDTSLQDVKIRWVIQPGAPGRVAFVRDPFNGINAKPGSVIGWRQEFTNPQRVSDTEFTWDDRNRVAGGPRQRKHDYDIDMVQDGRRCHVDPIIINDY